MIDYKHILQLKSEKVSQRGIAEALRCSRNTVAAVLVSATDKLLGRREVVALDNGEIRRLLFLELGSKPSAYTKPDSELIHYDLGRTGITLLLLWNEYANRCRGADAVSYQKAFREMCVS